MGLDCGNDAGSVSKPVCSCCCRETGERYRREMLAHGGGKEPMMMVEGKQTGICFKLRDVHE